MDTVDLQAEPRTILGKQVKQLRRQGQVPANLYGKNRPSTALQLEERMVTQRIGRASRSTLFSLALAGGQKPTVLIKEIQRHPISRRILHVDFFQVNLAEKIRASVPLHFVGDAPAVKEFSGTLLTNLSAVEVEALPGDLPGGFEVDLSGLATLDDAIHVSDISLPSGVEILTPAEEVVARVAPPRVQEEVAEVAAPTEAAATAEAAEPAEAATAESE